MIRSVYNLPLSTLTIFLSNLHFRFILSTLFLHSLPFNVYSYSLLSTSSISLLSDVYPLPSASPLLPTQHPSLHTIIIIFHITKYIHPLLIRFEALSSCMGRLETITLLPHSRQPKMFKMEGAKPPGWRLKDSK